VLGDDSAEKAIEDGVVVHELGPDALLKAGDVGLLAGSLGTRRKVQRHGGHGASQLRAHVGAACERKCQLRGSR
jgi:hypothetical protein